MWARCSGQLVWVSRRASRTLSASVTAAKAQPAAMRRQPRRRRSSALGAVGTALVCRGGPLLAPALLERLLRDLLVQLLRFLGALHRVPLRSVAGRQARARPPPRRARVTVGEELARRLDGFNSQTNALAPV